MTELFQAPYSPDEDIVQQFAERITQLQKQVAELKRAPADAIEIKSDAGDYADADSWNGRRVLNTADNTYKIFAENSWRTIISY